jgi:hypothetical protein|tara:strand:- start:245 stop:1201 length:957 start_codon:yes stop_codon:yes gene_type:complete
MNKENIHSELGLTQEELIKIVRGTRDSNTLKGVDGKLENCDLSRPSIELINENDLQAVIDISNGVKSKYLGKSYSGIYKTLLISFAVLLFIGVGLVGLLKEEEVVSVAPHEAEFAVIEKLATLNEVTPFELYSELKEDSISSEENDLLEVVKNPEETKIDEIIDSIVVINTDLGKRSKEINKKVAEKSIEDPSINKISRKSRRVRDIIVTGTIDDKYKGDSYEVSDLVDFQGGTKQLEKEIYRSLKSKIKDEDIPFSSTTIVFNFEVTSRGKVKKVSVQSRTTSELESVIIKAIEGLDTWNKGSKRASKNYSVFITFR